MKLVEDSIPLNQDGQSAKIYSPPSTINREVTRNNGDDQYRAAQANPATWDRARRPKLCKLASIGTLTSKAKCSSKTADSE